MLLRIDTGHHTSLLVIDSVVRHNSVSHLLPSKRLPIQALTIMRRFKWHTLGTIGALILAHVVIFVIMVLLIMGVQESITDLNSSALVRPIQTRGVR